MIKLFLVLVLGSLVVLLIVTQTTVFSSLFQSGIKPIEPTPYYAYVQFQGFDVYLNDNGTPRLVEVAGTSVPMLNYFGMNANGQYRAYLLSPDSERGVEIVIEDTKGSRIGTFQPGGWYWSPTNPKLAAYTTSIDSTTSAGLVLYNIETHQQSVVKTRGIDGPVYWSPDGSFVRAHEIIEGQETAPEDSSFAFPEPLFRSLDVVITVDGTVSELRITSQKDDSGLLLPRMLEPRNISKVKPWGSKYLLIADPQVYQIPFPNGAILEVTAASRDRFYLRNATQGISLTIPQDRQDWGNHHLQRILPTGFILQVLDQNLPAGKTWKLIFVSTEGKTEELFNTAITSPQ